MFCPHKNSYLQLATSVDPKLVNKAVRRAMRKTQFDPHDELPATQRMVSMQPSLYGPWVDITRTRMGFDRLGLRIISKNITSDDSFIKLQAIHTLLDQVRISESAVFLVNLNVVYHLINLLEDRDPIVKEKVCLILMHLMNCYQGRKRILAQPVIVDRLMFLFMRERKEIRYAAALCLRTLCKHGCGCETLIKNENIIENLLKAVKNEHVGIIILHLDSLKNLTDWDPTRALRANAVQVMMQLIALKENRITRAALGCLRQLCKHSVGKKLADKLDMTRRLIRHLKSEDIHVIISTVSVMQYTTITTMSKWRIREFAYELARRLVKLCIRYDAPVLQMRAMQTLINMCDSPDARLYIKNNLGRQISKIKIRVPDQWDGTTETKDYGLETGHEYRTRYIKSVENIKVDLGDNEESINVPSYLARVQSTKSRLINKVNSTPQKD